MEYSVEFKTLVKNCVTKNAHIGGGNPNAKILFVGQEAAYDGKTNEYKANIEYWNSEINNPKSQLYLEYPDDFSGGHTWKKYQKLHNYIFPEFIPEKRMMNFHERIFTTEMSDNPAKKNSQVKEKYPNFKIDLQKRKETFFNEGFIQNFPVIILACSNYIENNPKNWELNKLFKVEYINKHLYLEKFEGFKLYSRGNWYYLHLNKEQTKLVIHTRQLSTNVNNDLLEDMGKIIRAHLINNDLL